MGVAYLEVNKLPSLHEIDIPKCIKVQFRVYSIYRTKLGVISCSVLSFLICFQIYETLFHLTYIQGLFCVVQYVDDLQNELWCNWLIFLRIFSAFQGCFLPSFKMNELIFALLLHKTSPHEIKRENTRFVSFLLCKSLGNCCKV